MPRADRSTNRAQDRDRGLVAQSISLPKGRGAIREIGEEFAPNPVRGTGSITVPVATSQGLGSWGSSLSSDSGSGNGLFGFGRSLSLPSITRRTDKALLRYLHLNESDVLVLST